MKNNPTSFFQSTSKILFLHFSLFSFCSVFLYYFLYNNLFIEWTQFIQWDTNWYLSIVKNGYVFTEKSQNNTGFFPLFPILWKYTTLGTAGICLLNSLLFISSYYLLVLFFKPTEKTQYLFLSAPSFFFFLVPYSESLFFLFCCLIIIGLKKNNGWLTFVSLILATLTRSAGTIFIPALIVCIYFLSNYSSVKERALEYGSYIIACTATTAFVIYLQYLQTGVWFAAAATHKYWGHYLGIPEYPFRSWGKPEITKLDGSGMLIGVIAMAILFNFFLLKIKNKPLEKTNYFLFSLLYLSGIVASMILFQRGDLHSLNRYIFATPFYFIFLLEIEKQHFPLRRILLAFLLFNLYWILFGSLLHITTLLYYIGLSLYFTVFLLIYHTKERVANWSFIFIYITSTFIQAYFFVRFLHGEWIG